MAHDVFISYSSKDKSIADAVCSILESTQIRCWIAPRDITPGVPFAEAIIDGIKASRVFLLIFSSNSNQSHQVSKEVERAVHHGISIIPLRIEDVPMSKQMEFYVSNVHWLDAITPPLEQHVQKLSKVVHLLLSMNKVEDEEVKEAFEESPMEFASYHEKTPGPVLQSNTQQRETNHSVKKSLSSQQKKPASARKKLFIPLLLLAGVFVISFFVWFFVLNPDPETDPIDLTGITEGPTDSIDHGEMPVVETYRESGPKPKPAPRLITEEPSPAPAESGPVARDLAEKSAPEPGPEEKPGLSTKVQEGIDAFNSGQYHLSIRLMEGVLTSDPENISALYYMSEAKKKLEGVVQPLFESARQSYERGAYAESIKELEYILQVDPSHNSSKQYLDLARTNLSSQQIGLVVHQYVRSVENHELLAFYERNCTSSLFAMLEENVRHMMATYLKMQVSIRNLSIRFNDMDQATVSFNCKLTGLYNPDDVRQVLFEGLQEWVVRKESDRWLMEKIEFKS